MPLKRPHTKTKTGCFNCKQRKIKCDENKPSCRNCQGRFQCSFLRYIPLGSQPRKTRVLTPLSQKSRSPSSETQVITPPLSQSPGTPRRLDCLPVQFSALEMELLHFYTTQTSPTILGSHLTGTDIWQTEMITFSFQNLPVLQSMFSLAALHLKSVHITNPSLSKKYHDISADYNVRVLSRFREDIQDITRENATEIYTVSTLGLFGPWAMPSTGVGLTGRGFFYSPGADPSEGGLGIPWYSLYGGALEVQRQAFNHVTEKQIWDPTRLSFARLARNVDDLPLLPAEEELHFDQLAEFLRTSDLVSPEDEELLNLFRQRLRYIFRLLLAEDGLNEAVRIVCWTWDMEISVRLCIMLDERFPPALILLALYTLVLKRLESFWWMRGKAESLLVGLIRYLPAEYEAWVEWPIREVGLGWKVDGIDMLNLRY